MALNKYRVELIAEYESEVDAVDEIAEVITAAVKEHATVTSVRFLS